MNRTTQFIMPLFIETKYYKEFKAYLAFNKLEGIPDKIILTCENNEYENYIKEHIHYYGCITFNNKIYYLLIIPDELKKDFEKFIIGNYSKISLENKKKIILFWKNKNKSIYNIVKNTLINIEETRKSLLDYLYSDEDKAKGKKILETIHEVNSKIIIEEEIIKISNYDTNKNQKITS